MRVSCVSALPSQAQAELPPLCALLIVERRAAAIDCRALPAPDRLGEGIIVAGAQGGVVVGPQGDGALEALAQTVVDAPLQLAEQVADAAAAVGDVALEGGHVGLQPRLGDAQVDDVAAGGWLGPLAGGRRRRLGGSRRG